MSSTSTQPARTIPLALTALVALFSALVALALSGGMNMAQAHGNAPATRAMHGHGELLAPKAVQLRQDMRKLWEDHITWTRLAIISLESGTPDTNATVARLLRNQVEIGNALKPYYGAKVGKAVTGLLREHILIAADLIGAAKAGDNINPRFWKLGAM